MSAATLFPMPDRRHAWGKLDYELTQRPDCMPEHRSLIVALMYLADGAGSIVSLRRDIMDAARLKLDKYLACMRWLRSIGAIHETKEPRAISGRRIILQWMREAGQLQTTQTNVMEARAPDLQGRALRTFKGARSGPAPVLLRDFEREEEDVPSPTPSLTPTDPEIEPTQDGTGRDDCASLPEGDQDDTHALSTPQASQEAQEAIAERQAIADAILAEAGSERTLEAPAWRRKRALRAVALREIAQLAAGDLTPIRPETARPEAPPPPMPFPRDAAGKQRPVGWARVLPDETYPKDVAIELCRALERDHENAEVKERLAVHLTKRYRDPKPVTLGHFRDAMELGGGCLIDVIEQCESRTTQVPSNRFSKKTAELLAKNRRDQAHRQTKEKGSGLPLLR